MKKKKGNNAYHYFYLASLLAVFIGAIFVHFLVTKSNFSPLANAKLGYAGSSAIIENRTEEKREKFKKN